MGAVKFLAAVLKSLLNSQSNNRDAHDSKEWVDVPYEDSGTARSQCKRQNTKSELKRANRR